MACEYDVDCDLPDKCCDGFFAKFCCDVGGTLQRHKPRVLRNATFPRYPLPTPGPIPVPAFEPAGA